MFYKDKQIIKKAGKVYEQQEVDKIEVQKQLDLLNTEETRRIAEIKAEFAVKKAELNSYLI